MISTTLNLTGLRMRAIAISTATACGSSIGNKVISEIIINKHNKYKKQYEKDQQRIRSFANFCRKFLQDNIIDKSDYESVCNVYTKYIDETKNEFF